MNNHLSDRLLSVFAVLTGVVLYTTVHAADDSEKLSQAQWNVPRSATTIIQMTPIQNTIRKYQAKDGTRIQIRFAGGDEGTLWVYELRSWLVSLGIPSADIELIPGASDPAQLELSVINTIKTSRQVKSTTQIQ